MSASKENRMQLQRGVFLSKHRQSLKNLYNINNNNQSMNKNFYTTLQNGFGQRKLGRKGSQGSSMQGSCLIDFSKTIGVVSDSNNNNVWMRPQSKHSGRNVINVTRPQTSKGSRKQPLQMNNTMKVCQIIRKQPQ